MNKIITVLWTLLSVFTLSAQNISTEAKTLVVKTVDGNVVKYNLSDIEEITFESEPTETAIVTRLLNLTPDFISVVGLEENETLTAGSDAVLTIMAGPVLDGTFQDYHFEHVHVQVNDRVIVPTVPDGYTPVSELKIPFKVPSGDCDIVVCYSGQQQLIETGYTMTLEENPNVTMFGVSPDLHYKYFDAYLLTNEAFVITDAEFKMGGGEWQPVNGTPGCAFSRNETVENLYNITIRPDYQNVTGDVVVRVSGEQHSRYAISWINADTKYLDMEQSILPSEAIDGDMVTAALYINDDFYLKDATSPNVEVNTIHGAYVQFTMPASDTTVTLNFENKIPVSVTDSEYVAKAEIYNAPDIYYGWPISIATPGESVYVIASAEKGYKPMTVTTDDGRTFSFSHYGLDMYLCEVSVPQDAASMSVSVACAEAWTVSSQQTIQCNDGDLYAEGETVTFSIQVPAGKKISKVDAVTVSGKAVPVTLDYPYATFEMPAEDVVVTVTFDDLSVGETISVIAYFDEDEYDVSSSTNYDWDFAEGFSMDKDGTFYLSVYGYYGEEFYVGVKIGDTSQTFAATEDEESGEYTFGKAFVASGDVTIKVGPTESSVSL